MDRQPCLRLCLANLCLVANPSIFLVNPAPVRWTPMNCRPNPSWQPSMADQEACVSFVFFSAFTLCYCATSDTHIGTDTDRLPHYCGITTYTGLPCKNTRIDNPVIPFLKSRYRLFPSPSSVLFFHIALTRLSARAAGKNSCLALASEWFAEGVARSLGTSSWLGPTCGRHECSMLTP